MYSNISTPYSANTLNMKMNEIIQNVQMKKEEAGLIGNNEHINFYYGRLINNQNASDDKLSYSKSINLNNLKSNEELEIANIEQSNNLLNSLLFQNNTSNKSNLKNAL